MTDPTTTERYDLTMACWRCAIAPRSLHRANRAWLARDLVYDHVEQLFKQQRRRCAICGLPFSLANFDGVWVMHPFAPTLDHISSQGGYTANNVQLDASWSILE